MFGNFIRYKMNPGPSDHGDRVLFIAAYDQLIQEQYADRLSAYYGGNPVRFEDLAFWKMVKNLRSTYESVYILPWDRINPQTLKEALLSVESLGKSWDSLLLLHGLPNRLLGTRHEDLADDLKTVEESEGSDQENSHITYQHLAPLKGKLGHLRLAYLHACYGESLSDDFLEMGADYVISFDKLHRNFFYVHYLMYYLRKNPDSIPEAFKKTNERYRSKIRRSLTFSWLIKQMNMKQASYLDSLKNPLLSP